MEGERTRRGAAAARVTSHQATRRSAAAAAASGTRAGGRDPAELIRLLHGCAAAWLSGGRAPIILDSIIKCRVITRYGALLPLPSGRAGEGLIGMGEGGVFAQMSAVPCVFVSGEGGEGLDGDKTAEGLERAAAKRVTGPRGGNVSDVAPGLTLTGARCCVGGSGVGGPLAYL